MAARIGYLGLGSNVGDRRVALQEAVGELERDHVRVLASSSVYDTDPIGEVLDQASFLNACLRVETELAPLDLLHAAKAIERRLGRTPDGVRHGPRRIDIDLLLLGDLQLREPPLVLPHEQLLHRRFVLIPLVELDPELTLPGGERAADALAALPVSEGVRWAGAPLAV